MMRAILLASATATSIGGFRSSICVSQGFLFLSERRACRTTAVLPMISNLLSVRSPFFVIEPASAYLSWSSVWE